MTATVRIKKLKKGEIIPLNFDYVFTRIFNNKKNIEIVESLVACFIRIPLKEVHGNLEIKSRVLPIDNKHEQDSRIDLLLNYKGQVINIELNNELLSSGVVDRNVCYICKMHGNQLKYGVSDYRKINSTIQICLNTKIKNESEIVEEYYFANKKGKILTKKVKILNVDVEKGSKECYNKSDINPIALWCEIITTNNEQEQKKKLEMLGEEIMTKKAKEKLVNEVNKYSTDDEVVGIYTKLSHQEIIKNGLISSAKEEGYILGEQKGYLLGEKQAKLKDARNFLALGVDIETVRKATDLPIEEILSLEEESVKKVA